MTAVEGRIARLEERTGGHRLAGRFITVRGGAFTPAEAGAFLASQGVILGRSDIVFYETHADPDGGEPMGIDAPLTYHLIPVYGRIEDHLAELD